LGLPHAPALVHTLAQLGLDVIHTQHPWLLGAFGTRLARRHRLPLVTTVHTQYEMYSHYARPLPPQVVRGWLRSSVRRHCDRCTVVATPGAAMKAYLQQLGVRRPIEVVPNATDLSGFDTADGTSVRQSLGVAPEEILYLFVGRAAREKSLDALIEAFCQAAEKLPLARLLIVGGGPELEALRKAARERSCAERILLPGPVPYAQVHPYYAAADVFVTASVTEVQPLSLNEALCARAPIVAFDAGGINDMVADGETGLLAPVDEGPQGLARRMVRLGTDPALRQQLAEAGSVACRRYHIPAATERLLEVYELALREGHRT
jgi:glycosyltransferase involved in cell wall biosynthesis